MLAFTALEMLAKIRHAEYLREAEEYRRRTGSAQNDSRVRRAETAIRRPARRAAAVASRGCRGPYVPSLGAGGGSD
jgi:hypothetical protein